MPGANPPCLAWVYRADDLLTAGGFRCILHGSANKTTPEGQPRRFNGRRTAAHDKTCRAG